MSPLPDLVTAGPWLSEVLVATPTTAQLHRAATHAYQAALQGPYGLALDAQGALVVCVRMDTVRLARPDHWQASLTRIATAWRESLALDIPRPAAASNPLEDRIRHALHRAL
jgi:hypothetical protein